MILTSAALVLALSGQPETSPPSAPPEPAPTVTVTSEPEPAPTVTVAPTSTPLDLEDGESALLFFGIGMLVLIGGTLIGRDL